MDPISAAPLLTISDLETLKVISDPLRINILGIVNDCNMAGRFCSVKEIADTLDMPQTKLYYHIKQLEMHGLLVVGETNMISGILEKRYRVPAYKIVVDQDVFNTDEGKAALYPVLSKMTDEAYSDIQFILQNPQQKCDEETLALTHQTFRLPPGKMEEYTKRLKAMLKEIEAETELTPPDIATRHYSFFAAFYLKPSNLSEENADERN